MKITLSIFAAACAVVAGYFTIRHFEHRDLGFTRARKYVRNALKTLLHTEVTAAREAGTTPETTSEQAA